jgi:aminoglycoside 6'-N-acetyltransferase I
LSRIERLGPEHLEPGARLLAEVFNRAPWNERWTPETARAELEHVLNTPGSFGLVIYAGGSLAGLAAGHRHPLDRGEAYYLREMYVRPELQGRGLGSELMRELKRALKDRGVSILYLITHRGIPAESFYRMHGCKVSRRDVLMYVEL